jgi:hypothetical protein
MLISTARPPLEYTPYTHGNPLTQSVLVVYEPHGCDVALSQSPAVRQPWPAIESEPSNISCPPLCPHSGPVGYNPKCLISTDARGR